MENIVEKLFESLKTGGVNQKKISEKTGISRQNIGRMMSNNDMKVSQLELICDTFEVKIRDILDAGVMFDYSDALVESMYNGEMRSIFELYKEDRQQNKKLIAENAVLIENSKKIQTLEKLVKTQELTIELLQKK